MISVEQIKELRDKSGVSMMQCKKALEDAGGVMEEAEKLLVAQGAAIAEKKSSRSLGAGIIAAYVHSTRPMGAMVELLCESDFVAKNDEFKQLAYDIAMQVAAVPAETNEELLAQPFIKDGSRTVGEMITAAIQKFGENMALGRTHRMVVNG